MRTGIDITPGDCIEFRITEAIHTLARIDNKMNILDPGKQVVGSFKGFQASFHEKVAKSEAYYYLTLPKPPYKSAVNEVMSRIATIAENHKMPFIQLVGDLPVYALIVQLKNENINRFEKILPIIGAFHAQCSFIAAINKRFGGSELSDILSASGVIAEKSVEQALKGKHYSRACRALQLVYETLQRKIFSKGFDEGILLPEELKDKISSIANGNIPAEDIKIAVADLQHNEDFKKFVRNSYEIIEGQDSPMANFWFTFMEMVEILMMNIHSLRTQNWESFKCSIRLMLPWLVIYDNNNYGKWLVEYWLEMTNLPPNVSQFMTDGYFSQSMTGNPYSCLPYDLWIEMTMNKGSKMKAGWKSILKNEKMLLTHTMNANSINKIRSSLHDQGNLKHSRPGHKENTKFRLQEDEKCVQNLDSCIMEFDSNPFDLGNTVLRTMQSGQVASVKLVQDFETAHADGEKKVKEFCEERMFSARKSFYATVHRNKRNNFNNPPESKENDKGSSSKSIVMENKAMANIITLSLNNNQNVTLTELMQHRITDNCLSIFNVNGKMIKVQKSKLLEMFNFVPLSLNEESRAYTVIIDMGFIWRLATPTAEDREKSDGSQYTWGDYAKKIYQIIINRHKGADEFILVNDPYDLYLSIKDSEHDRRCNVKYLGGSANVFMKENVRLPGSREFNSIFRNDKNKMRLQQFLKDQLTKLGGNIKIIYSIQRDCYDLSTGEMVHEFECHHMEADTIIYYIYAQLRKQDYRNTVVIDAQDTDVIALSAYVSHKVEGTLALLRKGVLIYCKFLCSVEMAKIIVQLHVSTGADAISGFFGHGKMSIMKKVVKSESARGYLKGIDISFMSQPQRSLLSIL